MTENPFPDTVVSDWHFLDEDTSRHKCQVCHKSRKYYCYTCCVPLPHIKEKIPVVKLPIKVDIIKHPGEIDGKSTSPHAVILAPADVSIYTYPCIPEYDSEKVVLLFPGTESVRLQELAGSETASAAQGPESHGNSYNKRNDVRNVEPLQISSEKTIFTESERHPFLENDNMSSDSLFMTFEGDKCASEFKLPESALNNFGDSALKLTRKRALSNHSEDSATKQMKMGKYIPFEKIIFIDSTWNQTRTIVNDERLKSLKKVQLHSRNTNFWRSQDGIPKTYLSTIEAIYYCLLDLHSIFIQEDYNHQYDNLLFFFCHMFNKVHKTPNNGAGKKC